MGQPRHVAFFLPNMGGGGAEKATAQLANAMVADGIRVDVVLMKAEGPFLSELSIEVRVVDLEAQRFLTSIPRLAKYLRVHRPDVLYSQMFDTAVFAALARRLSGHRAKLFSTIHSTLSIQAAEAETMSLAGAKRRVTRLLSTAVHRWEVDGVVAVSKGVADDFSAYTQMPRNSIKVVYNSIGGDAIGIKAEEPLSHPWFRTEELPVFLGAGRLHEAKGFDTLIRAFAIVRAKQSCRLVILGEGQERRDLQSLAASLGVSDDLDMPGFTPNPYPYMKACAAFVLSSRREGYGMVIAEALAVGTRVIATDCKSGPREILEDGRYGKLVPVGDIEAMAQAMLGAIAGSTKAV